MNNLLIRDDTARAVETEGRHAGETAARPLLEVRGLVKNFGGVRAVDDISFALRPGQTVSIIGPNGSGKTTLFNLINGILRPDGGEVTLDGQRVSGFPPERIAELGVARTFQNGRVFGNMTVRENVLIGLHTRLRTARPLARFRHRPVLRWLPLLAEAALAMSRPPAVRREAAANDEEVDRQLSRFGERLLPRREALAFTLSYANRRRTEIARALAMKPHLLLLDEPTAGMNPTETAEVLEQIRALRAEGYTILLIEHKLDLVMALSDHVIVLDQGQVIAAGTPATMQRDERVIEAYLGRRHAPAPDRNGAEVSPPIAIRELGSKPRAQEPAAEPVLQLQEVDAFYGQFQALSGVSLRVEPGEIVCLLGGNASGKSTTMKTVLGLVEPRSGKVLIDGEDVTTLPTAGRIRRGLASVPEARRLFPDMTVAENLRMGAYLRRDLADIREDLDRMFELFPRLAERRGQLAGTMSGGEQQMVAMARALMSQPRLICMDEPTMGLAPIFVERVLDMITAINRGGVGVFMVEQNATLALSIAHRGYVLQNGAIVLSGAAGELLDNTAIQEAYLGRRAAR